MAMDERETVVTTRTDEATTAGGTTAVPPPAGHHDATVVADRRVVVRATEGEVVRRGIVSLFGLIQLLIVLRIVLLLLDAREANALVAGILTLSQIFVAPFEGILRTNALTEGGSVLDVAAIVALVGWTIVEVIILALVGVFRRDT